MKKYATEVELCSDFIDQVPKSCWTIYPEANGYDIFIVHKRTGFQIGVEAKLRQSLVLASQLATKARRKKIGAAPDLIVALLPTGAERKCLQQVTIALEVLILDTKDVDRRLSRIIVDFERRERHLAEKGEIPTRNRCAVPEVVGDDFAGSPNGPSCTPWKVAAIRLCLIMNRSGYLTSKDFKAQKVDMTYWQRHGRILASNRKEGRFTLYVKGPNWVPYDERHPSVVEQLVK